MKNRGIKGTVWIIVLILADRLTKRWAVAGLKDHDPVVLIRGVLELKYLENRGAAFGIFQNRQWFFVLVSVLVLAGIIFLSFRIPREGRFFPLMLCLCLIGAGAAGNMIDRVLHRYVVDFIYFKLIDFPIFNVADIYVTCAAFLLAFLVIFHYREEDLDRIFSPGRERGKADE